MVLSTFLGMSSVSLFFMWCMLELSGMLFLGLLWVDKSEGSSLSLMKYFLIQSFSSVLLILGIFIISDFVLMVGMLLKLGVFPFHLWSLDISKGLSWGSFFLMLSLQKMLPISVIVNLSFMEAPMLLIFILSMVVSCVGSFNKSDLKSLMFYSSLFNVSLMLLCSTKSSMLIYLFVGYVLVLVPCWYELKEVSSHMVQQIKLSSGVLWMFLSLGGFPPSMGFMLKLLIIKELLNNSVNMFVVTLVVLMSLYMFYIYMSMLISMMIYKDYCMVSMEKEKSGFMGFTHMLLLILVFYIFYSFTKSILKMGNGGIFKAICLM